MQIASTVANSRRHKNTRGEAKACIPFDVLSCCLRISQQIYGLSVLLIPHLPLIDQEQTGVVSKYRAEIRIRMWLWTKRSTLAQGCVLFS